MAQTQIAVPPQEDSNAPQKPSRPTYRVRLSQIVPNDRQPRQTFDPDTIEVLADHIQKEGLKRPLRLSTTKRFAPELKGKFILIGGGRRYRALMRIWERTGVEPTIDCTIEDLKSWEELFDEAFLDNVGGEDLPVLDEARAFALYAEQGLSYAEIGKKAGGKSDSYVIGRIKMHGLPEEVKKMLDPSLPREQQLAVTSAIDVAISIPPKAVDLRIELAKEAVDRQLDTGEVKALIERKAGKAGYGVGGALRRPRDDYKKWAIFLGRIVAALRRYRGHDFDTMYNTRDNEDDERAADAKSLRSIAASLVSLADRIAPPEKPKK